MLKKVREKAKNALKIKDKWECYFLFWLPASLLFWIPPIMFFTSLHLIPRVCTHLIITKASHMTRSPHGHPSHTASSSFNLLKNLVEPWNTFLYRRLQMSFLTDPDHIQSLQTINLGWQGCMRTLHNVKGLPPIPNFLINIIFYCLEHHLRNFHTTFIKPTFQHLKGNSCFEEKFIKVL